MPQQIGRLRPEDGERARASAISKAAAKRRQFFQPSSVLYNTDPKRCECDRSLRNADGACCKCGKLLAHVMH